MANPYVSKVVINGTTKLDLTSDTVDAAHLQSGYTAHNKAGAPITGTLDVPTVQSSKSYSVLANGSFTVTPDSGYDGMEAVALTVNVPATPTQTKSMTLGAAAPATVTPDSGYALSSVSPSIDTSVIKAENIAEGVTMLGITGTHSGGGGTQKGGLKFTAQQANSTISGSITGSLPNLSLEYSYDGATWNTFTPGTTTITLASVGDYVYFAGENDSVSLNSSNYFNFVMTGRIAASGNMQSLLDITLGTESVSSYCYYRLFYNCTSLTTAPALPATTLASYCYNSMFYGCTSLTTAPALPATTLASNCYNFMFKDCTGLTTAPALPATTLARYCYNYMFRGCTGLTTAPALPATTLASGCYYYMFYDCTSLTTAPALPATTLASDCYNGMFYNCTSLTTAPALPATTLASDCYYYMFYRCTALQVYSSSGTGHTNAWRIPTSGTASSYTSQTRMFYGTTGSYASASSVTLNATFYTQNTPVS